MLKPSQRRFIHSSFVRAKTTVLSAAATAAAAVVTTNHHHHKNHDNDDDDDKIKTFTIKKKTIKSTKTVNISSMDSFLAFFFFFRLFFYIVRSFLEYFCHIYRGRRR